jgi:hypothetical protein
MLKIEKVGFMTPATWAGSGGADQGARLHGLHALDKRSDAARRLRARLD